MKQLLLSVVGSILSLSAISQTFTIPYDTVFATVQTSANLHNDITNISGSDIQVAWRVSNHNLPSDWASSFAICDNNLCYYNINNSLLGGNTYTTGPISPTMTGNFYVLPDLTAATTTGTYYVQVRMTANSNTVNSWYVISKNPTGIKTVKQEVSSIIAFPNPATDIVTVLIDDAIGGTSFVVTNLNGQTIKKETVSGNQASLDVSDLSNGLYFIQLLDTAGRLVGTTKFNKQ